MIPANSLKHLNVLIVDDNKHMRSLLNAMLSSAGCVGIKHAEDGESALALLRENPCDIVLTDMSMKPMDGLAFTRALRNTPGCRNNYVPVIMITGNTDKRQVEEARDAGVTEFVAKPVTARTLFDRIDEIVQRPRPFVQSGEFFGPDRRRRISRSPVPLRRADDADLTPR